MNKPELIAENKLLKENLDLLKSIQSKSLYRIFNCANCGNPFVLNTGQYNRRFDKGFSFTCSSGHSNVFDK